MNKKGAEMTISTLVIIVLGLIVLVVIALGFGMGWSSLWGKLSGYFSTVNVDSIKSSCEYSCNTQASFSYCCEVKELRYEKGVDPILITCDSNSGRLNMDPCGDVTCNENVCKEVVCGGSVTETKDGNPIVYGLAMVGKDECKADDQKKFTNRKLGADLVSIAKDMVCCGTEIPGASVTS